MPKKINTEEFIKKAKTIHDDKYDYSLVDYKNSATKVIIICKEHGEFLQVPNNHLNCQGCQKCATKITTKKCSYNTEKFIEKAKEKHGDKYDYSKTLYRHSKEDVLIICSIHGEFTQIANAHILGRGCELCAIVKRANGLRRTKEDFIKLASIKHNNKYSYTKSLYIQTDTDIIITCPTHGDFQQRPSKHLDGAGCKKCAVIKVGKDKIKTNEEFVAQAKKTTFKSI